MVNIFRFRSRLFLAFLISCVGMSFYASSYAYDLMQAIAQWETQDEAIMEMNDTIVQPYLLKIDKSFQKIDSSLPTDTIDQQQKRYRILADLSREIDRGEKLLRARTDMTSIRREVLQKVYNHMQKRTTELMNKTH